MKNTRHCTNPPSGHLNTPAVPGCSAHERTQAHRISWRKSIAWLTSPAFRIHRYRNIHTRMLRSALCTIDCGEVGQRTEDDGRRTRT